jgi:uncharacterized membrane protein (DUF485 family)
VSDTPEGPSLAALLVELGIKRNVAIGLVLGVLIALAAYIYRIVLVDAAPGVESSPILFGALAVTLAVSVAGFVVLVLTIVTAIRRVRRIE